MFSKLIALCALVAVSQAGLLAEPVHYSSAAAVSSQSIVRHDQPQAVATKLVAAPVAKYAVASPVTYQTEAAHYTYQAAPVAYQASPVHYSSDESVSSQNIVRHEQPQTIAYHSAPASYSYHAAPTPIAYHAAPTPIAYQAAPEHVAYHAAPVHYSAPIAVAQQEEKAIYPKYEYTYSVADGHTGDNKSQQESRDGDEVKGSYSFHEADGSIRTVEYSADAHSGFNAVVHNTAPTAAPVHVKAAPAYGYESPALQYYKH